MNYRDRKLLDLAHRVCECQNCGSYFADGCEPAHQNGVESGKGHGIKGRDNRHAALCHWCHAWYDSGIGRSPCGVWAGQRSQKAAMWVRAHLRTFDYYFKEGWIKVA